MGEYRVCLSTNGGEVIGYSRSCMRYFSPPYVTVPEYGSLPPGCDVPGSPTATSFYRLIVDSGEASITGRRLYRWPAKGNSGKSIICHMLLVRFLPQMAYLFDTSFVRIAGSCYSASLAPLWGRWGRVWPFWVLVATTTRACVAPL